MGYLLCQCLLKKKKYNKKLFLKQEHHWQPIRLYYAAHGERIQGYPSSDCHEIQLDPHNKC